MTINTHANAHVFTKHMNTLVFNLPNSPGWPGNFSVRTGFDYPHEVRPARSTLDPNEAPTTLQVFMYYMHGIHNKIRPDRPLH